MTNQQQQQQQQQPRHCATMAAQSTFYMCAQLITLHTLHLKAFNPTVGHAPQHQNKTTYKLLQTK
jgi:hypothetical protein